MKKRDAYAGRMAGGATGSAERAAQSVRARGVLHQKVAASRFVLARHEPSAALAPFVAWYWIVRWDLRGQPPHDQTVLPHPNVHLAFESAGSAIYGVLGRELFELAAVLGYADQAHLTRDFTAVIGVPPARYVAVATTASQVSEPKP